MTQELLSLLSRVTKRGVGWQDVVIMNNVAVVPPMRDEQGDYVWNRGFNVVVLNRLGMPTFFCKCRGLHDQRLAHETDTMLALRANERLKFLLPPTYEARSERVRVLATKFLAGKALNELLDGKFNRRKAKIVRHVLDEVIALSRDSSVALPNMMNGRREVDLSGETSDLLDYLCGVGLRAEDARTMRAVLQECERMPRQLQHGDLWSANVVRSRSRFWFLDFEMFGRVQVPMYDVFHFLRTSADRWAEPGRRSWLDQALEGGEVSALMRAELRRAAPTLGLDLSQTVAALVYYVVHFAVTTHRRNPEGQVWKVFFQEAQCLADHIREGRVRQLLHGPAGGV